MKLNTSYMDAATHLSPCIAVEKFMVEIFGSSKFQLPTGGWQVKMNIISFNASISGCEKAGVGEWLWALKLHKEPCMVVAGGDLGLKNPFVKRSG